MSRYMITFTFEAKDMAEAEDRAARLLPYTTSWARSGLYYSDPVSGKTRLWSEPALSAEELRLRREAAVEEGHVHAYEYTGDIETFGDYWERYACPCGKSKLVRVPD